MSNITRSTFLRGIAIAAGTTLVASAAFAQTSPTQQQVNPTVQDAEKSRHKGRGGTQQGPGTHGHSSSPVPGETKEIQQRQHNMPATPSHPSKPGSPGTSG